MEEKLGGPGPVFSQTGKQREKLFLPGTHENDCLLVEEEQRLDHEDGFFEKDEAKPGLWTPNGAASSGG